MPSVQELSNGSSINIFQLILPLNKHYS